jgi:hypothetical protein
VVVLGVERGGDVAVVVVEIGRWWWQRRSGGLSLVTWWSWVVCVSTSSPRGGPNVGVNRGARWRGWQPCVVVVVVNGGGGGERKGWDGHNV